MPIFAIMSNNYIGPLHNDVAPIKAIEEPTDAIQTAGAGVCWKKRGECDSNTP